MKYGLPEPAIRELCAVFARYPQVEKAVLYGSRAKGNYKNGSDIDLTLHGGNDLTLRVLYSIANALDDGPLPYTIDLSFFATSVTPIWLSHISVSRRYHVYKRA